MMAATYFLSMPSSVLNLDPSSTGFSAGGALDGVPALDVSLELRADAVVEPGRAFSADRSAMAGWTVFLSSTTSAWGARAECSGVQRSGVEGGRDEASERAEWWGN
jgi:hypothetical protein